MDNLQTPKILLVFIVKKLPQLFLSWKSWSTFSLTCFPVETCQLSPEWLEEKIISGEADQSKPDVLPDVTVVPRMVLGCFVLELVCVFVCVRDPRVACKLSHVLLPYRRVSVPLVGHFAHPQMLQRTNLSHLQKVPLSGSGGAAGLLCVLQVWFQQPGPAQVSSFSVLCINTQHKNLSFCCQPVAECSGDGNSAGTWDIIYSMQTPILGNIKRWNKTHKGWLLWHYLAFRCVFMPRVLCLGHYNTNLHWQFQGTAQRLISGKCF